MRQILCGLGISLVLATTLAAQAPPPPCPAGIVDVAGLKKSGAEYQAAVSFLQALNTELDPGEAEYLGGREMVRRYISSLVGDKVSYLGVAKVTYKKQPNKTIHAFLNGCGSSLPAGEVALVVNLDGGFWVRAAAVSGQPGGTSLARAFIMLHELCHALDCPGFPADWESDGIREHSYDILRKHFAKTLAAFNKERQ